MKSNNSPKKQTYKVTLVGPTSVGKTSILNRIYNDDFSPNTRPTTSVEIQSKTLKNKNGEDVNISFWDTAGQERYKSLGTLYYQSTSLCLGVFDIVREESFEQLKDYLEIYKENCGLDPKILIIANKSDLFNDSSLFDKYLEWGDQNNYTIIKTSAVTGEGIFEVLALIAELLSSHINLIPEPSENNIEITISDEPIKSKTCC